MYICLINAMLKEKINPSTWRMSMLYALDIIIIKMSWQFVGELNNLICSSYLLEIKMTQMQRVVINLGLKSKDMSYLICLIFKTKFDYMIIV